MNMKKIQKRIVALLCLTMLMLTSCADKKIPAGAQDFIKQYFPDTSVVLVEIDEEDDEMEYSVWLNDGTKVDFDMQGDWKRVARKKTGVPANLIPTPIAQYLKESHSEAAVFKLSKKDYGYKIELSTDIALKFNEQGQFLTMDD